MPQVIAGSFATGPTSSVGNVSGELMIHSSVTTMRLTLQGLDASNTVKTQRRTSSGGTWVDQTTYSSNQNSVPVTVASGQEWRVFQVSQQALRDVQFKLSLES